MTESQTSAPFLSIDRLSKNYGDLKAIDNISLDLPRGEFLTLLGPSGSGKTTLLMALAGFVTPSSGEIRLEGRNLVSLPPEKRDLGVVFQGYALFPHMTVTENVAFPLEVRGMSRAEIGKRVATALETVQLSALGERRPSQLSGGQQQRVALARALVFSPPVILLDEPLSALDRQLRADLQEELKTLHRKLGSTFINVTHDQDEALSMSTLIAVINNGRVAQCGTPAQIYESPESTFVAHFVGRSNVIDAQVLGTESDGRIRFTAGGHAIFGRTAIEQDAGAEVALSIRPEKLEVSKTSRDGANSILGTVSGCGYHGNSLQISVETSAGAIRVEAQAWRLGFTPAPGDAVYVTFPDDVPVMLRRDD